MKISARGIGFIGLPILLLGCLVESIFVGSAGVAFMIALVTGLDTPMGASSGAEPVPSLGQLNCPLLIGKNELGTVDVGVSNQTKSSQQVNLKISADQRALTTPFAPDTTIAVAPLETVAKKWNFQLDKVGSYLIWVKMFNGDLSSSSFYADTYCTLLVIDTYGLTTAQFEIAGLASVIIGGVLVAVSLHDRRSSKVKSPL